MSTTTAKTIVLQITPFHDCGGCTKKLVKELRKFGARLLAVDFTKGKCTISTAVQPEVIRAALQLIFPNMSVHLLLNHQADGISIPLAMMSLPQAERMQKVEWTRDGLRIDFYDIRPSAVADVRSEYVPPPPTAPPIPTTQGYAYGHPVGLHAYPPIIDDDRQFCTIV